MKKISKKIIAFMASFVMILGIMPASVKVNAAGRASVQSSEQQVVSSGQEVSGADGVKINKTIKGTDVENVFDITLDVQTPESIDKVMEIEEADVVVVLDISNTMNEKYRGKASDYTQSSGTGNGGAWSRYDEALATADAFIDAYAAQASSTCKLGFVAFNTHAHEAAALTTCADKEDATAIKRQIRNKLNPILTADNYEDLRTRFTNIEAGLTMANDMLGNASGRSKHIVFLSDGFPTTYLDRTTSEKYDGYDPYTPNAKSSSEGNFYDGWRGKACDYGTSYSDRAAIKAREKATAIKEAGTEIYSIGIDVGEQTIDKYVDAMKNNPFAVVDVEASATKYELGSSSSKEAFRTWLQGTKTTGIGSGHYYSSDEHTLAQAFKDILGNVVIASNTMSSVSTQVWTVSDPMSNHTMGDDIDFLLFYDKKGNPVNANQAGGLVLQGAQAEGGENTAAFNTETQSISWDLKNSGYTAVTSGNTTTYHYSLKYRVRLTNEAADFKEMNGTEGVIPTNGTTSLNYVTKRTEDGNTTFTPQTPLEFVVPTVKGFLGEFEFIKKDAKTGAVVPNAEFELVHKADCAVCAAIKDGGKTQANFVTDTALDTPQIAMSDDDGRVAFQNIPSGHVYAMKETKAPNYIVSDKVYEVVVAYNAVTIDGDAAAAFTTVTNEPRIPYTLEGDTAIKGTKKLVGRDMEETDKFTFDLTAADETTEKAMENGTILCENTSVQNTGEEFAFGAISFTKEGTYLFEVTEKEGSLKGITYDDTVYNVEVSVVSEGEDKLVGNVTITKNGEEAEIEFVNTYTPVSSPKTLDAKPLVLWVSVLTFAAAGIWVSVRFQFRKVRK